MGKTGETRYQTIKQILIVILLLNWGVAFAKIIYGLCIHSAGITADGFHSLSDGASNIIGIIGITLASQPKDKDHPYGHKKYETFFSLAIAALLFLVSFELIETSFRRFSNPVIPRIDLISFIVMLATLGVNLFVMRYEFKQGTSLQSDILVSDSLHTKADVFVSLSVIISLIVIKLGFPIFDPIVAIAIGILIAYSGITIARRSSGVLCDKAVIIDEHCVISIVKGIKGVKDCHKVRTRGRIDDIHIDLHVQVNPHMHVDDAHKICYQIEDAIKKGVPGVTDVIVHIEPRETH